MRSVFILTVSIILYAQPLKLSVMYDPFKNGSVKRVEKEKRVAKRKEEKVKIEIDAIYNKTVFIDNKRYKIGDIVFGYKLIDIKQKYAKFQKKSKILIIPLWNKKIVNIMERK